MTSSTQPKSAGVTGLFVLALVTALLAGAVLVRLVDDGEAPAASGSSFDQVKEPITGAAPTAEPSGGPVRVGSVAPDFTLLDLDGQPASLSDWRGRPVLINFWATWCGPCEIEMPAIQAVYEAHKEDGFAVLAVAVDDSAKNVRSFFENYELTFQPLMDDGTAARLYQVFGLPTSFFVGSDGKITAVHTGMMTEDRIEEYLAVSTQN